MSKFSDLRNRIFYAGLLAIIGLPCLLTVPTTAGFIGFLLTGFILEVFGKLREAANPSDQAVKVTKTFAAVGIAGFICAYVLRTLNHGIYNLLIVALGVAFTDIFAYAGGRLFGRTKLAPDISPNKTVEGWICGLIMGMAALFITWHILKTNQDTAIRQTGIILSMLFLPLLASLSDLLESWAKRLLRIKDFGDILGAHGGIADRFDAMTAGFIVLTVIIGITS